MRESGKTSDRTSTDRHGGEPPAFGTGTVVVWGVVLLALLTGLGRTDPATSAPVPGPVSEPAPAEPMLLRVGLATDLEEVSIPCCRESLILAAGGRRWAVRSPLRVLPAAGRAERGFFRLQVAALKDEGQADDLAAELRARSGYAAEVHFDAGVDLYRVRVGRFAGREEAEAARGRLEVLGVTDAWIVGEGGGISDPAFVLVRPGEARDAADAVRLPGRWLSLRAAADEKVEVGVEGGAEGSAESATEPSVPGLAPGIGRYRGRWLIYLNDRGRLNLINEVDLEDYLRSVVPSEMGPDLYDRLEALKAQAVAARTYTLRNLGEFESEGYDICATPRCQVYRGVASEHPLSDRAVAETARQVLVYQGRLIDARYSATCGGHTEDVSVVFPLEQAPYLRGVPCPEAGSQRLAGDLPAGAPFPQAWLERWLPVDSRDPRARLEGRLRQLARLAGLPASQDRLRSLERAEVRRFVGSLFDLVLDPRMLEPADELAARVDDPPVGWGEGDLDRARRLLASGLLDRDPRLLTGDERARLPLALGELLGLIDEEVAYHLGVVEGHLHVRRPDGEREDLPLPAGLPTFQRRGNAEVAAPLALVAGDRLRLVRRGRNVHEGEPGELLAVIQEVDPVQAAFLLRSPYASWSRFKSDDELVRRVATRYPGFELRDFQVLSRGVSGRIGEIRLVGSDGRQVEVAGLAVRWTLGVPDTNFTARRSHGRDGRPGWLFTGSGWGHGVGLCQIGSVDLAGRGASYREILQHYYTGVELARARSLPERWQDAGPEVATLPARARR